MQQPPSSEAGKSAPTTPAETPRPAESPAQAPLAQAEGSVDEVPVRFVITELRRRGPTVIVNARVEALRPQGEVAGQINQTFSDGQYQEGAAESDIFDGVALIDPLRGGPTPRPVGRGEEDPVAANEVKGEDNPRGRAKNRRVTVSFRR